MHIQAAHWNAQRNTRISTIMKLFHVTLACASKMPECLEILVADNTWVPVFLLPFEFHQPYHSGRSLKIMIYHHEEEDGFSMGKLLIIIFTVILRGGPHPEIQTVLSGNPATLKLLSRTAWVAIGILWSGMRQSTVQECNFHNSQFTLVRKCLRYI